ncbi:hypothetical protein Ahy_A07g034698 [Arachis hypogaea]|uniref:Uncharacterized protein n=1 Tax=Arachis hypogaea TaxID=3818 RepID=A0A445CCH4_ARAHY|nr:hypothetical protein Ahy_A07g034698 [Arachis hypogaea]
MSSNHLLLHTGMDAVGEEVNINELRDIDCEEDNNNSEEEFEANYEVADEKDDGDPVGNSAVQNEAHAIHMGLDAVGKKVNVDEFENIDWKEDNNNRYSRKEHEYNKNYQRLKERGSIVVNRYDKRNEMFEICEIGEFVLIGDLSIWTRYEGAKVIANSTLRHMTKGRPKSTRYLNETDSRDMLGPRQCTICGWEEHSRSRCLQCAGLSSAGGQ